MVHSHTACAAGSRRLPRGSRAYCHRVIYCQPVTRALSLAPRTTNTMKTREQIRKQALPLHAPQPSPSFLTRLSELMESARRAPLRAWVLLPLRLFLGVTFVYAGLQKLTDPQFFRPSARSYIGKQITAFATGSPLHSLLIHGVLPHAQFFGALIAYGELAIGLGTLAGLLMRPAAFFGALLNLTFFLSADWRVYPYFYGSDIIFLFGWITLIIAGPVAGGWAALDTLLTEWLLARAGPARRETLAGILAFTLGVNPLASVAKPSDEGAAPQPPAATLARGHGARAQPIRGRAAAYAHARAQTRRDFMRGALSGAAGMLGVVLLVSLFHHGDNVPAGTGGSSGVAAPTDTAVANGTAPSSTAGGANVIAQVSQVPTNSSATFTIPSNSDPGVVVHLTNGKFAAFDATCTHAGCPVEYDPQSQLLLCPCHGAAFDPANNAAVVQGPANTPLVPVNIQVNSSTGAIILAG